MPAASSPASSNLEKFATIPELLQVELEANSSNSLKFNTKQLSFFSGGIEGAQIIVAFSDYVVWVFKLYDNNKTCDLMSDSKGSSFFGFHATGSENDIDCLSKYQLVASIQLKDTDKLKTGLVFPVMKNTFQTGSNESLEYCSNFTVSSWNCVALAFESGRIRFCSEDLKPLCEVTWVTTCIKSVKISSITLPCRDNPDEPSSATMGLPKKPKSSDRHSDYLIVLSEDQSVYTVPLNELCENLFTWKLYHAKIESSISSTQLKIPEALREDLITKWTLLDQETAIDVHVVPSIIEPNLFQHLQVASLLGGFNARPKSRAPRYIRFVATGHSPYLGIYDHILESADSSTGPNLAKLASNYANRLKSSFWSASSSWIYGQPAADSAQPVKATMKEDKLNLRIGFNDSPRLTEQSVFSPLGNLVALSDNLSRVLVFDILQSTIVRIFKGYRNAKLGWYVASYSQPNPNKSSQSGHTHRTRSSKQNTRHALFLVIHATKRSLLEVWPMKLGQRAAAFNVSKTSVMLTNPSQDQSNNDQILIVDQLTREVFRLVVPYHFAFTDLSGSRQKDVVLSNRISQALSKPDTLNEPISQFLSSSFSQLQSHNFISENLSLISSYDHLDVQTCSDVLRQVDLFLTKHESASLQTLEPGKESSTSYSLQFKHQAVKLRMQYMKMFLCNEFYRDIWNLYEPDNDDNMALPIDASDLLEQLQMLSHSSNNDFNINLFHMAESIDIGENVSQDTIAANTMTAQSPIFENLEHIVGLSEFFQFFELNKSSEAFSTEEEICITPRNGLTTQQKAKLGAFLFFPTLKGDVKVDSLLQLVQSHGFENNRMALLDILLSYWLSEEKLLDNYQDSVEMLHLHSLVSWMLNSTNANSEESKSKWEFIRNMLQRSFNVTAALTAAIMIRGICISSLANQRAETKLKTSSLSNEKQVSLNGDVDKEKWLKLSYDIELFNLLIYRLEDCVLFAALNASSSKPNILSVDSILSEGKGALSEFLSKWLIEEKVTTAQYKLLSTHKTTISATMIRSLHKKLPISLKDDNVFCQTAWLAALKWTSDMENYPELKHFSLDYLSKITDHAIKCGTAHLLWAKLFHRLVLSLWDHLNKSTEPLVPRSMFKDLNVNMRFHLIDLLTYCKQLMDVMLSEPNYEDVSSWDLSASELLRPSYDCEEHWIEASRGNQECIPELSQKQPRCNYSLLQHMKLLISCLQQFVCYDMFRKYSLRPNNVFDDVQIQAFSQSLHSFPLTSSRDVTQALLAARHDFFEKCFFECTIKNSKSRDLEKCNDDYNSLYEMGGALDLSSDWLIQTHVASLYWVSMDSTASNLVPKVADQQNLALRLVEILAYRVQVIVNNKIKSHGVVNVQSRVSSNLSLWLKTTKASPFHSNSAVVVDSERGNDSTCNMASLVMKLLPENHSLYNMCLNVIDCLKMLKSM